MIPLIKKILFATDLSATASNAFGFAVAMADRLEAELLVLHVLKQEPGFNTEVVKMGLGEDLFNEMEKKKAQSARNVLIGKRTEAHAIGEKIHSLFNEAEQRLKSQRPLQMKEIIVEAPSISDEILRLSEAKACDLIIMAHRSRKLFSEGENILKKVLKASEIPVVLVPSRASAD